MPATADIFSVLPPQGLAESAPRQQKPDLGDDAFRDVMDDAVRNSRSARENSAPRSNRDKSPEPVSHAKEFDQANNTIREPENYSSQTAPGGPASAENQEKIIDRLQSLELRQEQIDALLEFLNLDSEASLDSLFGALVNRLNQQLGSGGLPSNPSLLQGANALSQQDLAALLQQRENLAMDFLRQAGLSDLEAKNFLAKLQQTAVDKLSIQNQANLKALSPEAVKLADQINQILGEGTKAKVGGENNPQGKPDLLSQFNQQSGVKGTAETSASIEKILDPSGKNPGNLFADKPQLLKDLLPEGRNQATLTQFDNFLKGSPLKGNEGVKIAAQLQTQNTEVVAINSAKTIDGGKPVLPQTVSLRNAPGSQIIEQIVSKFSLRTNGGQNEINIKLDPPSLGTVRMNITTAGDLVRTVIVTENHVVKQIIENNFSQLRDSMIGQGLKVDSFSVLVGGNPGQSGNSKGNHGEESETKQLDPAKPLSPEQPVQVFGPSLPKDGNGERTSIHVIA